jgi:alpha/beta superfamily hydrolase
MQKFPENEATFLLNGPAGDLEVFATSPDGATSQTPIGIVCHPHPLHGGTMTNKVVTTLARTLKELNLRTVRFNFRGVGKSVGAFDNGKGESDDLLAIIQWVKEIYPNAPIWLAGFSFGAYIAAKMATQIPIAKLICVAPPVINFSMQDLPAITCPWIVVQGDQDEIVSAEAVFAWAENRNPKPIIIRMHGAGHFFHGQLLEMRRLLDEVLR